MTRRGAIIGVFLAAVGVRMEAQETTGRWWRPAPPWLHVKLGGEDGLSKVEIVGPDGRTITLTPEQIMAALAEN